MITSGLDASGLTLINFDPGDPAANLPAEATVFATPDGLSKLRKKISDFESKDWVKPDKPPKPRNANLAQSIDAIVESALKALWRSPIGKFPDDGEEHAWEIWINKPEAEAFLAGAPAHGVTLSADRLEFPDDIVVIGIAKQTALASAIRKLGSVRALAAPNVTAEFFDGMEPEEQDAWTNELQGLLTFAGDDPSYVTILDQGVSRAHPLILPALKAEDRHAADPAWGVEDPSGHGTGLAGLALFGDLSRTLTTQLPVEVRHRLESSKIIPDAGHNPHHLLGAITRAGINACEISGERRRAFALATTTEDDTPHDGAPTSWSSELDQLAAGVSGAKRSPRLLVVSAGNTVQSMFGNDPDYLATCDHADNELEAPAQAWNAVAVGAYTEKVTLTGGVGHPLAPFGDLSPRSRTASWSSHWPIKPDVVMEGGNWIVDGMPPPLDHTDLSLLTTSHSYPLRSFTTSGDTSAATALAAGAIADLWTDYPALWPESVRALFVSSARWTTQMRSHLPANPDKGDYEKLFRRCGFGVPDMARARRSASNALTLVVQDTLIPYARGKKKSDDHRHNEMKLFTLPWPVEALRALGATPVTLRVALSTFIEPNPSEPARGDKFRYASHNLRFKLNWADENAAQFAARINKIAEQPDEPAVDGQDGWVFGRNRRDVGSIQIDELKALAASDLARRNLIAVHPVSGWWKFDRATDPSTRVARFCLIVEIDASETAADLYAEVRTAVEALVPATIVV
jgi:hypothetical protein